MKNTQIKIGQEIKTKDGTGKILASWWSEDCGEWKHAVRFDAPIKATVTTDPHEMVILEREIIFPNGQDEKFPPLKD